jgi:hypothetical protein
MGGGGDLCVRFCGGGATAPPADGILGSERISRLELFEE